jgi:hypothetical protein
MHNRRMAPRQKKCFFSDEITGTEVTNPKSILVSRPSKDVGFRDIFSCDIQRYVSNDQAYGKLSGNED